MTIICKRYDLTTHHTDTIEQSQVSSSLKQEQTLLWIELKLPSDSELDWLGQTFSLQPDSVKLVQTKEGYPSFDWQEEYYIFTSTAVRFDEQQVLHDSVYLICGQNYMITVEYQPIGLLPGVRRQWESNQKLEYPAFYFLYLVLDSIVDSYIEVVRALRLQIDELHHISVEKGQINVPQKVNEIMAHLNEADHLISSSFISEYAFLRKEEGHSLYPIADSQIYFRRHYTHSQYAEDLIQKNKEILTSLLHQIQTRQADHLNTLINRLTVVTIILSTAAVITGFYGINVGGLEPNTNNKYGAIFVVALLVVLGIIQFLLLRPLWRRKS